MSTEIPKQPVAFSEGRECDLRKSVRRKEDRVLLQTMQERHRKLQSLLELGQIIALDLQLEGMLLQIAQKASEVMEADRCTIFLHDPQTDELWSTVAMGLPDRVIRIPSGSGLAGHAFKTGETVSLEDAYEDPRFNREVDASTGYRTRSVLCMPVYNRAGSTLGVIQLLNKKDGVFTEEDVTFLETFANHISVFIEMAQLKTSRIEALERSREELKRLNRAKDKAIHHLSHELGTPIAIIQGIVRLLKRKLTTSLPPAHWAGFFEALDTHLNRLTEIHREADDIIRSYEKLHEGPLHEEMERPSSSETVPLFSLVHQVVEDAKPRAGRREVSLLLEGDEDLRVRSDPEILKEVLEGLLKNAFENTPDEGTIKIVMESKDQRALLKVQDSGIGITEGNLGHIFDGLHPTQETELYASKRPYDFNAGGKGLDLLRMKVYSLNYGFEIAAESQRCVHLPTDRVICPGRISACTHCGGPQDCVASGGSTFWVSLPVASHRRRTDT